MNMREGEGYLFMRQSPEEPGLGEREGPDTMEGIRVKGKGRGEMSLVWGSCLEKRQSLGNG